RRVVELVLVEVEAADHGGDAATARVQRDEGRLHFGQLGDAPGLLADLDDAHQGAGTQLDVGPRLVRQAALHRFQTFAGDFNRLIVLANDNHFLGVDLQHDGRQQ